MDFLLVLAATFLGFRGAPWWSVLIVAFVLTSLSLSRHVPRARRYQSAQAVHTFSLALLLSGLNNVAYSVIAFGLGRGVALLVAA